MKKFNLFGKEVYVLTRKEKEALHGMIQECKNGMLYIGMVKSGAFDNDPLEKGTILDDAHDCFAEIEYALHMITGTKQES